MNSNFYSFYWVYEFYNNFQIKDSSKYKFDLKFLKIEGVDEVSYECEKCKNGFSKPGSGRCSKCPENYYFDEISNVYRIKYNFSIKI